MTLELPYGARPLPCPEPAFARLRVVAPPPPAPLPDLAAALDGALAHPSGARPLSTVPTARSRVVIVVPGAADDAPRAALFAAVRRALPAVRDDHLTIAVANGGRAPAPLERLGLPPEVFARHRVVNHDARDEAATVEMGRTSRGTRLRVNRCVAEADLVIATGSVHPHPFAGYEGGAMGIFPGLAHHVDARAWRALAADPASALGQADGNPCREDVEEAVRRLGRDTYMLDVASPGGVVVGAAAGDVVYAHRDAVALARPWCEVRAPRADVVVASAPLPFTASLASATRLVAPAGLLLCDGGVVVLAAECPRGTGPIEAVNEELFAKSLRRYLPARHAVLLVSALDEVTVARTFATFAPGLEAALRRARDIIGKEPLDVAVLPDAADLVPRPAEG